MALLVVIVVSCADESNGPLEEDDDSSGQADDDDSSASALVAELAAYNAVKAAIQDDTLSVEEIEAIVADVASQGDVVAEFEVDEYQVTLAFASGLEGYIGLWEPTGYWEFDLDPEWSRAAPPPSAKRRDSDTQGDHRASGGTGRPAASAIAAVVPRDLGVENFEEGEFETFIRSGLTALIEPAERAGFEVPEPLFNQEADLDFFRSLDQYRFVYIVTHGFKRPGGHVAMMTGEVVPAGGLDVLVEYPSLHGIGSQMHDWDVYVTVNHRFFEQGSFDFQDTTLYLDACRVMADQAMVDALKGEGGNVISWDARAIPELSMRIATQLTDVLFDVDRTTDSAFGAAVIVGGDFADQCWAPVSVDDLMPICVNRNVFTADEVTYQCNADDWDCDSIFTTLDYELSLTAADGNDVLKHGNEDLDGDGVPAASDCDDADSAVGANCGPADEDWAEVTTGPDHTCARRHNGEVVCWGCGDQTGTPPDYGQCDAPVDLFTQLSAGNRHTCGVRQDGTVACWGANADLQCDAPGGNFVQVESGTWHTCGLDAAGNVECWGCSSGEPGIDCGQCDEPVGSFVSIAVGDDHSCGIRADGSAECWGGVPGTIPQEAFDQIDSHYFHGCGVTQDGWISCWGCDINDYGQCEDPGVAFREVSAGWLHNCGIVSDGFIQCWGNVNEDGPADPPEGDYIQVSTTLYHSCALGSDWHLDCWGCQGHYDEGQCDVPP